ncbi:MAG: hypothetical protein ACD_75C00331G0002 [uncultured bacterium]|nr:MAG: hypothetical protein ACD_75C00331G0002 [uncultured bacterium]
MSDTNSRDAQLLASPAEKGSLLHRTPLVKAVVKYRKYNEIRREAEFMPASLEVLDRPPAPFSRVMLIFIVVFAAFVIGWASLAKMDIVVGAMGVVIPKGKVKVVQPLEQGMITAISVRDGQMVKKGDPLVSIDNTDSVVDINTLRQDLAKAELTILRLEAELQNNAALFAPAPEFDKQAVLLQSRLLEQSIAAYKERQAALETDIERCQAERESIEADLRRLTESLPLSQELYDKKRILAERKLISNTELLQAQIEISDAQHNLLAAGSRLQEADARLLRSKEEKGLVATEYRRDLLNGLTEARNSQESLGHQLAKAENKQTHFELKAPADGIVQQLAIHTIGGVVTAAQPLMVIVPTDGGLEIEAKVLNKDIGFITERQDVSVKVAAYPFTQYGDLQGSIEWVARDAVIDKDMGPNYPIRVSVHGYQLPNIINGRQGVIAPGMTVTADVKVGQRRVIEYFIGPILRYKDQSLREI